MGLGKLSAALKLLFIIILFVLQVTMIFFAVGFLRNYFAVTYIVLEFACMVTIVMLINKHGKAPSV